MKRHNGELEARSTRDKHLERMDAVSERAMTAWHARYEEDIAHALDGKTVDSDVSD